MFYDLSIATRNPGADDMATYNVTYERQGRTDYVIVLAKDSIDAERQVRRMFPGASYYFALYVGE